MNNCAIITAAGSGRRMNSEMKKQFIEIGNKPIILHTLDTFVEAKAFQKIIITCPAPDIDFLHELLFQFYDYDPNLIIIIKGGSRRQDSVYNALKTLDEKTEIVSIHDSVRPFVKVSEILQSIEMAKQYGAVTLAHPVKNTIKKVKDDQVIETLDREQLWEVYTPQTFSFDQIMEAHRQADEKNISVSDDAELIELIGLPVHVLKGTSLNIKITDPVDLILAKLLIKEI